MSLLLFSESSTVSSLQLLCTESHRHMSIARKPNIPKHFSRRFCHSKIEHTFPSNFSVQKRIESTSFRSFVWKFWIFSFWKIGMKSAWVHKRNWQLWLFERPNYEEQTIQHKTIVRSWTNEAHSWIRTANILLKHFQLIFGRHCCWIGFHKKKKYSNARPKSFFDFNSVFFFVDFFSLSPRS